VKKQEIHSKFRFVQLINSSQFEWKSTIGTFLLYLLFGLALFGPFMSNPFLMDDEIQVTGNAHIQDINEWPTFFSSSTMAGGGTKTMGGIYFKPLMTLYYASVWKIAGADPAAFRLPLLLLHIFSSYLICLILRRFFSGLGPIFAGLIFLVHPGNCEIVAYIADAQDALYMFFGLFGLWLFTNLKLNSRFATGCLFIFLAASLLSKETGILFFILIPFYSFLFQPRLFKIAVGCSTILFVGYMGLRWHAGLLTFQHPVLLIQQATWLERLQTVPLILWHYLEIFFFPWRIFLVSDFVNHDISFENFWLPLLGDLFLVGALVLLFKQIRAQKYRLLFVFALATTLVWFGLHGNAVIPLDGTYADRWLYLESFAGLIFLLLAIPEAFFLRRSGQVLLVAVVVLFFARTWVRLQDWQSPIELYQREFSMRPFDAIM
jgi:hypothetical protein